MSGPDHTGADGAQTVHRAIGLLREVVDRRGPVSLTELATGSGLTTSTTHRLMRSLEASGLVTRADRGRGYVVGGDLVAMSARVMHDVSLVALARTAMDELGRLTEETVALHLRVGSNRTCIASVEGVHPVRRVIDLGQTLPVYKGPTGKVILAHLPEPERLEVMHRAAQDGEDLERIERQLAGIRRDGYMASVGDRTPGVGGLSVPIFGAQGVLASLTISGPGERWTEEAMRVIAPTVVERAGELSRSLGVRQAAAVA